ncbi:putative bifunctional diguanylate cyclase/phosphodiesterase [Baekduia soli]|uniref:putative bifunctional diguanylate cyclase/phosphodiesterase n=1 Tax=Baekduia soli TaxID=496014 RepID=UPI001651C825|nr:EAL domain-containing protein [Baekduia soli]
MLRLLLVEDDEDDYVITRSLLDTQRRVRFDIDWAQSYDAALNAIREDRHDLYVVDYRLGQLTGLDLIRDAWGSDPKAPVILLTGQDDYEVDLQATRLGVTDYLVKGSIDTPSLERTIRYAVRHHQAMLDLRRSEERYAVAVRATNDGIWDWDLAAGSMHFSPRWRALLGYNENLISDTPAAWFDLVHPDDIDRLHCAIDHHLAGRSAHFENEHRILHADGRWRWVLSRGLATYHPSGEAVRLTGSLSDVTERHDAQQQLVHDALHDSLTGLPNRILFMDRLAHCLRHHERDRDSHCAVLFIDIDRFKLVNDSLSHAAGDCVLIELARRTKGVLRPDDTVGRLGGDEFVILLNRIERLTDAEATANRVQRSIAEPIHAEGRELIITASIGISHSGAEITAGADELIRSADIAMYDAKRKGGARCEVFDPSMRQRLVSRVSLEAELREAIDTRRMRAFFQPIVDLGTGTIRGFEALARWPAGPSEVSPARFIPVAEEAGLIGALGRLMLHDACRTLGDWRGRGVVERDTTVSVNVSPRQLTDPALINEVRSALADSGLPGSSLVLEITESTLIERPEQIRDKLHELLALGVHIHLDDFGTGYSSLTVLHHFPGNTLKIDRAFVDTLANREESQVIIRSIIGLAHNLGLRVIAEGIEHPGQIEVLTTLGCEYGQGYYYGRPLPAADLELLLADGGTRHVHSVAVRR